MGILWVLHGVRFPIFGNLFFFLAFLRCKFKLVFDGGAAHFREFIGSCFAFLRFLILVQPIFWNLLGIVWESVGSPLGAWFSGIC